MGGAIPFSTITSCFKCNEGKMYYALLLFSQFFCYEVDDTSMENVGKNSFSGRISSHMLLPRL